MGETEEKAKKYKAIIAPQSPQDVMTQIKYTHPKFTKKEVKELVDKENKTVLLNNLITSAFNWLSNNEYMSMILTVLFLEIVRKFRPCSKGFNALVNVLEGVTITTQLQKYGGEMADVLSYAGLGVTSVAAMSSLLTEEAGCLDKSGNKIPSRSELARDATPDWLFFLGPQWKDVWRKVAP